MQCQYQKVMRYHGPNGEKIPTQCNAHAVRGQLYCYHHAKLLERPEGVILKYAIWDHVDRTYHVGGGHWSIDRERAVWYESYKAAELELDEVDCDEILRDRLHVVPDDSPRRAVFGLKSPIFPTVDVPVGWTCAYCQEPIKEDDCGMIMPLGLLSGVTECAWHRRCLLQSVGAIPNELSPDSGDTPGG